MNAGGINVCYNCNQHGYFAREYPQMEKEEAEFQQPRFTEKQQFMITNPGGRDQPTA